MAAGTPGSFLTSGGLSPMGTGLPAAIAAKLERARQEVACICGDGGLLMYLGELATAVRQGLKITILLMADQALSSIKVKQVRADYPSTGVEFDRPEWARSGQRFRVPSRPSDPAGRLRRGAGRGAGGDLPTLVEASVDPEEYNTTQ